MFCTNCGSRVPNSAKFCQKCGENLSMFSGMFKDEIETPVQPAAQLKPEVMEPVARFIADHGMPPGAQPVNPVPQPQAPAVQQPVYRQPAVQAQPQVPVFNGMIPLKGMLFDANRITFRVKCPSCGNVQNAPLNYSCRKCRTQHAAVNPQDGFLYYYRMGNYFSSNVAATIWLNGQEYGGVGNTEGVILPLAPGEYDLQIGIRGVKKSEVIRIRILPGQVFCVKTSLVVHGFSNYTKLFTVDPSEMPNLY